MAKNKTVQDVMDAVDTTALIARPLSDWRPVLSQECGVYVYGETYLAKRFDAINYKFCEKDTAREILVDNLYALLRFKYFPKTSEDIDARINNIVKSFTANLKTTLRKVSFDVSSDADYVKLLPDYAVAFRNGVYDFKSNKWLFKYDVISLERIANKIYLYSKEWVIQWYLDYDFEPLPFNIMDTSFADFVQIMKDITSNHKTRNYCFELMYNIAHNENDVFSLDKLEHLAQILGYTMLQSFAQYFVLLIGSGQNGKNSLFDGCFTNRVVPRPAANDMESIETDRFITGALENKAHNIFLETSAKTYTESKMIKALTGSMFQTIESKGVSKYSGVINCKYIFAGNDQDKIKFSDNTTGFRRRINMFEIFYQWDNKKTFLKRGDYYDTSFSDSLSELKDDISNTTAYVYLAMYGILTGTSKFSSNFKFNFNDWQIKYADIDLVSKERIDRISCQMIGRFFADPSKADYLKTGLYDATKVSLYRSTSIVQVGLTNDPQAISTLFNDNDICSAYFSENDIYMTLQMLKDLIKNSDTASTFTRKIKQLYGLSTFIVVGANKPAIKINLINSRLKIVKS